MPSFIGYDHLTCQYLFGCSKLGRPRSDCLLENFSLRIDEFTFQRLLTKEKDKILDSLPVALCHMSNYERFMKRINEFLQMFLEKGGSFSYECAASLRRRRSSGPPINSIVASLGSLVRNSCICRYVSKYSRNSFYSSSGKYLLNSPM